MRAKHQHVAIGLLGQETPSRKARRWRVHIKSRGSVRFAALQRVVHQVSGDHGFVSLRVDAHAHVSGRVAGRGLKAYFRGQRVVCLHPLHQTGVDDGLHRIDHRLFAGGFARMRPMLVFHATE